MPAQVSYPLIAEGKVFVTAASSADNATRTPVLYALDQASGRTLWSQILPLGWQRANAAYDNGRIFVTGTNPVCCAAGGVTLAYAADSGTLLWRTELPGEYATTAAPTAANGVVYVSGSGAGALYAVSEDRTLTPANQLVLSHELRHALQDQYADVHRALPENPEPSDPVQQWRHLASNFVILDQLDPDDDPEELPPGCE